MGLTRLSLVLILISAGVQAFAQTPALPAPKTINLWPGIAPASEQWKQPESVMGPVGNRRIMNVSTPTLTAYLPDPSNATGTAVIIAPGGGFVWLSIDSEGYDVAKWLAARGIAGIVLKYRLFQVEGEDPGQVTKAANAALAAPQRDRSLIGSYSKYGIADGVEAVKVTRAHAAEWHISPDRIVFTGFSA
ncbi:MAG TPA: alpha/beta hydrolase, partial [Bryobacteraceae bacterium]|nr:alpha/beta hydrolase [Bryobacteraceae bacterium]